MITDEDRQASEGIVSFAADQQIVQIGDVRIGGQPGVRPTVLIGSIFYHGHDIFTDEEADKFDRDKAEQHIRMKEDFIERTGNLGMLDVVASTPEALRRHLEFAAGVTDMPLLVDGTTTEVRSAGLDYVAEAGLTDRAVYNSIQPDIRDEELQAIQKAGVTAAILLTTSRDFDFSAEGKVKSVREILPRLRDAGVSRLLVDTCVMDLATLGQSLNAMYLIKNEFGIPTGGGVHNAVALWRGLKNKMGRQAKAPCLASSVAIAVAVGADFVLYGPLEDAQYVYPAVAMTDTALSQIAMDRRLSLDEGHPRFRIV